MLLQKWRQGLMPVPKGKEIQWVASSKAGDGYQKVQKLFDSSL